MHGSTFILYLDPNLGNEKQILIYPRRKQCSLYIRIYIFWGYEFRLIITVLYISISTQLVVLTFAVALFGRRTVGGKV